MERKRLSRRDFLRLGAGAASGAMLAACVSATPQVVEVEKVVEKIVTVEVEKEAMAEPQRNAFGYVEWHPDEPVELVWWAHNVNDPTGPGANDRHILQGFHAMYPNIEVKGTPAGGWTAGAGVTPLERYAAAFAAGVDTPDVFIMHGASDLVVGNGWGLPVTEELMPIEDRERLGYVERRLLGTKGDDRVTELASIMHTPVLFCSVPAFEEAGLTRADLGDYFEDAIPALQELTKLEGDSVARAGWNMWSWLWPNLPVQAGSQYFNKETQKLEWSDDEAFMYACQFFRDLVQKHKVTSPEVMFDPTHGIPDDLSATTFNDSWMQRFYNLNRPDADTRVRKNLILKNQVGGDQKKGHLSLRYSVGIGVAANIEDPVREKAAVEFWKYCYYNTSNQVDLGWENVSAVTLKNPPDYETMMEVVPEEGSIDPSFRTAECLYVGFTHGGVEDVDEWLDLGQLRQQYPIFIAMCEELAATDRPIKEVVEDYQARCQTDWEENLWYIPGVVKA